MFTTTTSGTYEEKSHAARLSLEYLSYTAPMSPSVVPVTDLLIYQPL